MKKKRNKIAITLLVIVCIVAVSMMITALLCHRGNKVFIPPEFEAEAVSGLPEVDSILGYGKIYREGMNFSAMLCGNISLEENSAVVYFTNPIENEIWMKLRITDNNGNILGETGILRPGEYVRCVELKDVVAGKTEIKLKIMTYEPDTYYSNGAVTVNTVMTP